MYSGCTARPLRLCWLPIPLIPHCTLMRLEKARSGTLLIAAIAIAGSLLLFLLAREVEPHWASIPLRHVGSFILASVALALIFEFWLRRRFLDDMFEAAGVTQQLRRSGITGFSVSFYDNVPWAELFSNNNRLDIVFSYAQTWRNRYRPQLQELLNRQGARLRVVFPDVDCDVAINELAHRFGYTTEDLRNGSWRQKLSSGISPRPAPAT